MTEGPPMTEACLVPAPAHDRRARRRRWPRATPSRRRTPSSTPSPTPPRTDRSGQPPDPTRAVRHQLRRPDVVVAPVEPDLQVLVGQLLDQPLPPLDHGDRLLGA